MPKRLLRVFPEWTYVWKILQMPGLFELQELMDVKIKEVEEVKKLIIYFKYVE